MGKKTFIETVSSADEAIAKAVISRDIALQKALTSSSVDDIYKAQTYLKNVNAKGKGVDPKSMLFDPQQLWGAQGYKNKNYNLSYEMLRAMARTDIIKPIIETRKEQVLQFCEPQKDKYSTGFVIRPKKYKEKHGRLELTSAQEARIEWLTEFMLNCGINTNEWHGDNFHSFSRKFVEDMLTMDQGTFEIITDRRGIPVEFLATDGATFRIADSYNDEEHSGVREEEVNGYLPYYVQVYQSRIVEQFYPWELCFAIRNPKSSIMANGYGRSELEDLIENITAMLNSEQYNANYFKVGSNPKGFLRVSGNVNPARLEELKMQYQASMAGVRNAHKLGVLEADKMDFVSTQQSNKDMEWSKYQEFLIKISCAHYKMDPSEINFPLSGSSDAKPMFEGNNEARLKFSRDKGLKPLLQTKQQYENKFIINRLDSDYELVYMGLDAEDPQQELEHDIKAVQNYMTVNEIRAKHGLDPVSGGDMILNPIYLQAMLGTGNPGSDAQGNEDYTKAVEEIDPILKAMHAEIKKTFFK